MATEEEGGLRIRTEVVEVPVWKLLLPQGKQLELVAVPASETTIGSPAGEAGRDVCPQFRQKCERVDVEARRPLRLGSFSMVRHPISQGQWRAVVEGVAPQERELEAGPGKANPESLWDLHAQPGALAVDSVSWFDCGEWLARLNHWLKEEWIALSGFHSAAPELALPSESRWEVACRSGSNAPFHCGYRLYPSWANHNGNSIYCRGPKGEYLHRPTATGAVAVVNRWGLAEMHGQLLEWCGDRWHPDPVGPGWRQDSRAWEQPDAALEGLQDQQYRLLRSGSWIFDPRYCRAAYRNCFPPDDVFTGVGVRPCCFLPPGSLVSAP